MLPGAALSGKTILITGLAGLLAGAASMALGEWLSVQSSRELYKHQIEIEGHELESAPEEEEGELALIYQSKGLPKIRQNNLAAKIMENKDHDDRHPCQGRIRDRSARNWAALLWKLQLLLLYYSQSERSFLYFRLFSLKEYRQLF